jgi:cystathionine beta-lyase/cystathionine gamma-synthase
MTSDSDLNLHLHSTSATQFVDSICVHAGSQAHSATSAICGPIFQSSTFAFATPAAISLANQTPGVSNFYGRYGTPNSDEAQLALTALELGGRAAQVVGSGMAAASLVVLAHAKAGVHMVVQRTVYPTVAKLFADVLPRFGVAVDVVDRADDIDAFRRALRPDTALLYVETPANPTLALTDLAALVPLAPPNCVKVADSTFGTPFNQHPLALGFDYVIHSATKYLAGHSDVVAGAVVASSRELIDRLWPMHITLGAVLHPQEAFLLCRGLKTFALRMRQHNENALRVATFLETQRATVARVFYPGLPSHAQHELARRQMPSGCGGMVAFELVGGRDAGFRLLAAVRGTLTLAVSLGGVHTLITHPASTTASYLSDEELARSGIAPGLVRLSVGIEDVRDIIADLQHALDATHTQ